MKAPFTATNPINNLVTAAYPAWVKGDKDFRLTVKILADLTGNTKRGVRGILADHFSSATNPATATYGATLELLDS